MTHAIRLAATLHPLFAGCFLAGTLVGIIGCDALVGGQCSDGYDPFGSECVFVPQHNDYGGDGPGLSGSGGRVGTGGSVATGGSGSSTATGGALSCDDEFVACGNVCANIDNNISHCGHCDTHCATELCIEGICTGEAVGHLVAIGMSFSESTQPSQRLLGNAIFRTLHEPLRIAEIQQYAAQSSVSAIQAILESEATRRGRTFLVVPLDRKQIPGRLAAQYFDVLLIHDQPNAPLGALATFGQEIVSSVQGFAASGRTVVALATGSGSGQMCDFLTATGILSCTGFVSMMGQPIHNKVPTDVIGNGVIGPFLAKNITSVIATSATPSNEATVVFASDDNQPIVIHKVTAY